MKEYNITVHGMQDCILDTFNVSANSEEDAYHIGLTYWGGYDVSIVVTETT